GVGVTGDGSPTDLTPAGAIFFKQTQINATAGFKSGRDIDEDVALAAQSFFRPPSFITANNVLINGIRIPYVDASDFHGDLEHVDPLGTLGHAINVPLKGLTADPNLQSRYASGLPQASPAPY